MSEVDSTTVKVCYECRVAKPLAEFHAIKKNADGLRGMCRTCFNERRPVTAKPPEGYTPPESKACVRCGVLKLLAEYHPDRRATDGKQSHCGSCGNEGQKASASRPGGRERISRRESASKVKYRYGLTHAGYARLLESQHGVCATCGKPPRGGPKTKRLAVDHDHATGRVRGLLCHKCNTALAAFGDSIEGLMRVVEYLRTS